MEYKFKVGDRVKSKETGKLYTIDNTYIIKHDPEQPAYWTSKGWIGENHCELAEPAAHEYKVGDEVWIRRDNKEHWCKEFYELLPYKTTVTRIDKHFLGLERQPTGGLGLNLHNSWVEPYTGQDKLDGPSIDMIVVDEAAELPESAYKAIMDCSKDAHDFFIGTVGIPSAPEEPDVSGFDIDQLIKESKIMMGKPGGIPIDCYFSDTVLDKMLEMGCGNKGDAMAWLDQQKFTVELDLIGKWRLNLYE